MRRHTIRDAFRRDLVIPRPARRNHISEYPGASGRFARTLEEAFGAGAYLTIEEKRAAGLGVGKALLLALACAVAVGLYLAARG